MFTYALYYPHIDISNGEWLRTAILFWEKIETIVPLSINEPYKNNDTAICAQEGIISPLRCDLYGEVLEEIGSKLIATLNRTDLGLFRNVVPIGQNEDTWCLVHADKFGHQLQHQLRYARMRPEKMSAKLRYLLNFDEFEDEGGTWLRVDREFGGAYMAILAASLAKQLRTSPVTDEDYARGINLHALLEEFAAKTPSDKVGTLVTVTIEHTKIDPTVPIQEIIKFRRSRAGQLFDLEQEFEKFRSDLEGCEDDRDLIDKAGRVYRRRIEPNIRKLRDELSNSSIHWTAEGLLKAATISVPSAGFAHLAGLSAGAALAATAGLTIAGFGLKHYLDRRRIRSGSPYSYLLDIQNRFDPSVYERFSR